MLYQIVLILILVILALIIGKKLKKTDTKNELIYEDDIFRAVNEDGQRTSSYLAPQSYFGDGV